MVKRFIPALALVASVAAAATYQAGDSTAPTSLLPPAMSSTTAPAIAPRPAAPPWQPPRVAADPTIAGAISEWNRLRQSDRYSFGEYARFLLAHRGWPGETAMRKAAERVIAPDIEDARLVVAFFDRFPPATNFGRARQADALLALGRTDEARAAARAAWTGGVLTPQDEARVLGRFGSTIGILDHDRRMERLLWDRSTVAAQRQLASTSQGRRPIYGARLAMQLNQPDAASQGAALGPGADSDAGFVADRVRWLRDSAQTPAARAYLAAPRTLDAPPFDPAIWLKTLLETARAASADSQWSTAWAIASRIDTTFAPGIVVRDRPYGERDDYTSLAWLGGRTAMQLGRPGDAIAMFQRYALAAKSPSTQSKGHFWAGRAADAAGRRSEAEGHYARAAPHYDQFYGQLAAERLGRSIPAPQPAPVNVSASDRAAFANSELVRAVKWLGATGNWQDQTQFVRAIAASLERDSDHLLAADLAREIGRPDLGVLVARSARLDGSSDYVASGFPQLPVPPALSSSWTMIHAIMRQESQFDREAVSSAGARGMMQLMPGTAREQAGKSGLPYDYMRLTRDPAYNMMLGTGYFGRMMDQFGGSYVLAVAAYNAGPGNVRKFLAANGDPRMPNVDVIDWIEAIPLSETRGYVQHVLENAVVYDLLNPDKARMPARGRLSAYLGQRNAACRVASAC